ncbi:nitroreductase [Halioglobus japonicus]|uniref:Nitroreductase n=1 Tax=Halioglobus japonicus TaxID=930805 RepID=A0AAP8MI38_9GAMM|nr:nitroreductase [Halioglobus japonicus]AQA19069.1 nitroreductase [Halioglobus japonicus]PLW87907.1 nitroreductase [Halioglobus japonicus]GHD05903.1 nitroreductase NfnB [Halioglobus japonicus]
MSDSSDIFQAVVEGRRSLRAFEPEPIEPALLERIFNVAQRAPSNCNTQPWNVHVASGAVLEKLRTEIPERFMGGDISMDFPYDGVYDGVYKERQHGAAVALYDAVGVTREDKAGRHTQFMRNFTFFDAPHVAFLFLPEPFGLREAADLGMYAQTLMLTLTSHGLGSCPQTALSFQANFVREVLGVPETDKLVFGISFGRPVADAPANGCQTDRADLATAINFHQ